MFNEGLFYLCDCTCSNVIYVCSITWWSNPKIFFECFISFWKCFCVSLVFWKFFQKAKSFLLRNSYTSIFASVSQVRLLAPKLRKWGSEFPFLPKFYIESLATPSQVIQMASRETAPVHLRHLVTNSQVPREYLSYEMSRFLVFKEAHGDSFSNILFCLPHVSLNPKHSFHSNLNQNSMDFIPKTSLRYVLTLFIF